MRSFLGITSTQWQNALRASLGVFVLSAFAMAVVFNAEKSAVWCVPQAARVTGWGCG